MAAGSVYITAGLPVHKDSGQTPTGNGSVFITAGLPKVQEAAPGGNSVPSKWYYYQRMRSA